MLLVFLLKLALIVTNVHKHGECWSLTESYSLNDILLLLSYPVTFGKQEPFFVHVLPFNCSNAIYVSTGSTAVSLPQELDQPWKSLHIFLYIPDSADWPD